MFIVVTGDQNVGWVGEKILDILFSCNTRTGFSDRNSGPKLCAVSIANDGILFMIIYTTCTYFGLSISWLV